MVVQINAFVRRLRWSDKEWAELYKVLKIILSRRLKDRDYESLLVPLPTRQLNEVQRLHGVGTIWIRSLYE